MVSLRIETLDMGSKTEIEHALMHMPKFDLHFTAQAFAVYEKGAWRPQINRLLSMSHYGKPQCLNSDLCDGGWHSYLF